MSAIAIPQSLRLTPQNRVLCKRIGVKVDGKDMQGRVSSYSVPMNWALLIDGTLIRGIIEPYWKAT